MQKKLRIGSNEWIFYLLGLFSTMTALSFGGISVFYMLIIVAVLRRFIEIKMKLRFIPSRCKDILLISFFVLLSMVLNVMFYDYSILEGEWKPVIIKSSLVFVFMMLSISLLYGSDERVCLKKYFVDGLYASCICQLVWALLELVFWNWKNISLNEVVFQDFFHIGLNVNWTITSEHSLRIAGIGWEPAYFSLTMVTGYLLSKKKLLKFLFILGTIVSISRTGIIIMACAVVMEQLFFGPNKHSPKFLNHIIYLAIGIIFLGCCILFIPNIKNVAESTIISIINWNETTSGRTHFSYIRYLPDMLKEVQLGHLFFGYGYGASGLPYMLLHAKTYWNRTAAWSIESEWLNTFWGLGILGSIAYYSFIIKLIIKNHDKNVKILAVCLLIGGVFYVYSGTWLIFFFVLAYNNERSGMK